MEAEFKYTSSPFIVLIRIIEFLSSTKRYKYETLGIVEKTIDVCYGCMVYYKNDFREGTGFVASLCHDEICSTLIQSYRVSLNTTVYVRMISINRITIIDGILPANITCSIIPRVSFGATHEVASLYSTILSQEYCETYYVVQAKIPTYFAKIKFWDHGRFYFELS